ncbi:hypothetical protein Bcav_3199 [Beutenbergia cavernae DSM 12333]|uniref:ESX-1 secretion-associated protein n=1 Tax=Beutenbergia cavernae (strain ATCC BAA-8 / DSM 12333 / CCUG 43141 / JCM 11478 / NBRC 16432 / NCIMB 13614 / HKI 0122) TaxID=471853 RepID=C5C0P7_BEUC1|nr:type VII secretion target [Beutenbergia cavernae]ACQ81443.1 hypothetical protein Bcav_3199 [Beutenbergia cavernae DSM 12333]
MGDGYVVDTDAMRTHATNVGALASSLDEATAAGLETAMSNEAFGLLCQFLVPITTPVQAAAVTAVGATASAMGGVRDVVAGSAQLYDATDEALGGRLSRFLEGL